MPTSRTWTGAAVRANVRSWRSPGFPGDYRMLTLAGTAIAPKVSSVAGQRPFGVMSYDSSAGDGWNSIRSSLRPTCWSEFALRFQKSKMDSPSQRSTRNNSCVCSSS